MTVELIFTNVTDDNADLNFAFNINIFVLSHDRYVGGFKLEERFELYPDNWMKIGGWPVDLSNILDTQTIMEWRRYKIK